MNTYAVYYHVHICNVQCAYNTYLQLARRYVAVGISHRYI